MDGQTTQKHYPSSTKQRIKCHAQEHNSVSGEARTHNPSISDQAHWAPQLGSILCRYETCPTQYAPNLRGSILCMQGTQYAPRESILCMEHFVALQSLLFGCRNVNYQMKSFDIVFRWPRLLSVLILGDGSAVVVVVDSLFIVAPVVCVLFV